MVQKVYDNTTKFDMSVFVLDIIQRIIDNTIKSNEMDDLQASSKDI